MKNLILISGLILVFSCQEPEIERAVELDNKLDSLSYSMGLSLGKQIYNLQMEDYDTEILLQGVSDILEKKELLIQLGQGEEYLSRHGYNLRQKRLIDNLKRNEDFLKENLSNEGITTTQSGLQYEVIGEGSGPVPQAGHTVTLHYHGTFINDEVFDSTRDKDPVALKISEMPRGLKEAIMMMPIGSTWKIYIPSNLAFGATGGSLRIPRRATLIYEIELISIEN